MPTLPRFPFRIPALLYVLLSLACTQIPLLQTLGYEFSALTAPVASLVAGLTTARYISHRIIGADRPHIAPTIRTALVANLLLLLIPLTVMAGNALRIRNCSFPDGLIYFLLLPVVSVWFSVCLGAFCALHYRHPRTIFTVSVAASLFYALVLGYVTPAVYAYNVFFGFFPGLTYDEALQPDRTLLLFRLFTIGLGAVILWMALLLAKATRSDESTFTKGMSLLRALGARRRIGVTIALVACLTLVVLYRAELGFESPDGYVRDRLGAVYETPHFVIYYSAASTSPDEIRWIGAEHEFQLYRLMQTFRMPRYGTIRSYLYPSAEVKRELMGAGGTNIAKPWSGEIHLNIQAVPATLKHELVHVMAAPFGVPVIRAALRPGLVEGLAMAIEWDWGYRTLHEYAAGMKRFGVSTDVRALMSYTGFASRGSSASYVLAGSFCRYLIDTYSIRKMTQLYRTGDFQQVYGTDLDGLVAGWERFLDGIPVAGEDRDGIEALFMRPAMFFKVCARVTGARNRMAAGLLGERQYSRSAQVYGEAFTQSGSYESLSGYVVSALLAGDLGGVLAVRDTVVRRDLQPAQYFSLFVRFGLAAWATGDTAGATEMFDRVARSDALEDQTEAALLCRWAMSEPDNRAALLRYYLSGSGDSVRLAALDSMVQDAQVHWLPLYVKGKVLTRLHRREEAQRVLERINLQGVHPALEAFRLEMLGSCLFFQERFQEARAIFWTSLNYRTSESWRLKIEEWVDRCDWMQNGGKGGNGE